MGGVGYYVHNMVSQKEHMIELMGIPVKLPIAGWVVLAMALLFFASFFHMLYYGFKGYLRNRRTRRDIEKLADAIYWDILKAPKKHNYFDKEVRKVGVALDAGCDDLSRIDKKKCHDKIRDAIDIVMAVRHGEVVDLKGLNLDPRNPIAVQNAINILKAEPNRAEEFMRRADLHDPEVVKTATEIFVTSATDDELIRYKDFIDGDTLMKILDLQEEKDEKKRISLATIERLLKNLDPDDCDYVKVASRLIKLYNPNEVLALFEKMVREEDRALKAYIFTLIEFEMLDKAQELLQDTQQGEYLEFKAYLDLRRAGKHYPIDLLAGHC
jgi:hypothetical protein